MKNHAYYLLLILLSIGTLHANAQLNIVLENGTVYIKSANFGPPDPEIFTSIIDSLDKKLKGRPDDTTCLFQRALLLEQFNNQLAKAI